MPLLKYFFILILFLFFTLCGLYLYSKQKLEQYRLDYPPVGKIMEINGVLFHFITEGKGNPVILIHGSDGVLQDYEMTVFNQLSNEFQTIAIDRPGHGYSERPKKEKLNVKTNVDMLHQFLLNTMDEKPVIVGHSYGGTVALQYALKYPEHVSGLVLLSPGAFSRGTIVQPMYYLPKIPLIGNTLVHTLLIPFGQHIVPLMINPAFSPSETPSTYMETMKAFSLRPEQFKNFAEESRHHGKDMKELSPHYKDIHVPVTIITGEKDLIADPEFHAYPLHEALLNSEIIVIEGAGHQIHHTHPEIVINAIREMWKKIEQNSPGTN